MPKPTAKKKNAALTAAATARVKKSENAIAELPQEGQ